MIKTHFVFFQASLHAILYELIFVQSHLLYIASSILSAWTTAHAPNSNRLRAAAAAAAAAAEHDPIIYI